MNKLQLRDEAKDLLLKGCYKMAFNKYSRLIEAGSQGFTARQWAIVHLNQGISLQFMQQFEKAIESINRSLVIDPTYEKAYYRKLQILRDAGKIQEAVNSIPIWLKNKEIIQLHRQIKDQYLNSMGIDQLLTNLTSHENENIEFIKQGHSLFYRRLEQSLENQRNLQHFRVIGQKISKYYKQLKSKSTKLILESFLGVIHQLAIKQYDNKRYQREIKVLLESFWMAYLEKCEILQQKIFSENEIKASKQYQLTKYAPFCSKTLNFLRAVILHEQIEKDYLFQHSLFMVSHFLNFTSEIQLGSQLFETIKSFIDKLYNNLSRKKLHWLKHSFLLLESLITVHIGFDKQFQYQKLDRYTIFYLHYFYINKGQNNLQKTAFSKMNASMIINFISQNIDNFIVIYVFEHFVTKIDQNECKILINLIEQQMQILKQTNEIRAKLNKNIKLLQLQQQYYLIYTSILLKIDLKNTSNKVNIDTIINGKSSLNEENILSDLQINTLLLLAISNKQRMLQLIDKFNILTQIILSFLKSKFVDQIENVKMVISLIYILTIDIEEQQLQIYAKKMGNTVKQIKAAKKIQGEKQDPNLKKKITQKQLFCREYISKNWNQIIIKYCQLLGKINDNTTSIKWSKILCQCGKIQSHSYHNSHIISFLLDCFKIQKRYVGQLFSIFCKKANSQMIKYQYFQSISNILIYNVQNSDEELVIFQSLLGLINFTSNSSNKIKIPIKIIINAIYEENRYIVHAACSLLNNILAKEDNEQLLISNDRIKEVISKYVQFYRQQVLNDDGTPLTDYAHPSRVFSTLISLAMVLDIDNLQQFTSWKDIQFSLLKIKTSRAQILYKCVWYMNIKGRLKGNWWLKFERDLEQLKKIDNQRWLNIQKHIKR